MVKKINNTIKIRKIQENELPFLRKFAEDIFFATFAPFNTAEDMQSYGAKAFHIDQIKAEFNNENSTFYFAEQAHEIKGYIKLNREDAQTENKLDNSLEVERIYVHHKHQGSGVGKKLFEHALNICRAGEYDWLWLGVEDRNIKAIKFYEKNKLELFGSHHFFLGNDKQTDLLMRRKMR